MPVIRPGISAEKSTAMEETLEGPLATASRLATAFGRGHPYSGSAGFQRKTEHHIYEDDHESRSDRGSGAGSHQSGRCKSGGQAFLF